MKRLLAMCVLGLAWGGVYAAAEDELLEPDQAFALTTRVVDGQTLEATWKIAPGYYLYRDKFKFEALDANVTLKPALLPSSKAKTDPLFGSVETYVKNVTVKLPLERGANAATTTKLKITAQGCNEPIGVCYPPITKEVSFKLPAVIAKAAAADKPSLRSLKELAKAVEPHEAEPVNPEQAFRFNVTAAGAELKARVDIDDCCYLYKDKTKIELAGADGKPLPAGLRLGSFNLPAGKTKIDQFIGKTEIYTKSFEVRLPLEGVAADMGALQLKIGYQGCSEKGVSICYPPGTKTFRIAMQNGALAVTPEFGPPGGLPVATTAPIEGAPSSPVAPRDQKTFFLAVAAAFGAGLLLTFTPCVLPMIPIVSGAIVRSGDITVSKLQGGLLSYAYVLGTALTYTVAGVVAGATGEQLQAYFQNPWAIGTFAVILALLSLSMFGLYELQMPSFVQSVMHKHSHELRVKGGRYFGLFLMGVFSALIVGACVSPVLISVLGAAIVAKDPIMGGAIMFAMAHGQGVILIAIGIGAGFLLPKAGHWMDRVKYIFGVMLLAVAIYLLSFIPQVPVLFLWAALFIITAVYLGATQSLPKEASGWQYLWKGIGTVLLIWGVLALLGGMAGSRDILSPMPFSTTMVGTATAQPAPATEVHFLRVRNLTELDTKLAEAKAAGKPVLLDYYATWCTDCVRMEKATFTNPRVAAEMRRFVLLQTDVTDPSDVEAKAIKQRYGVFGPPAMLFFSPAGSEQRELRTYGFKTPEDFIALLKRVG